MGNGRLTAAAVTPHHGRTDYNPRPIRYRIVDDGDTKSRFRVVYHRGWEGYFIRWTDGCSGCLERGDYGQIYCSGGYDEKLQCEIGIGCDECGYTGKRRHAWFVALDRGAYDAWSDARYARGERLRHYFERRKRELAKGAA